MKKAFWKKFDSLMDSLPEYIESEINTVGENNIVIQKSTSGINKSTVTHNGDKIEVITKNGKTTIKVNSKEYVEKK